MLTVTIITRDGAKSLPECVKSAQRIADDIVVVVDSRTTDNTAQIAQSLGARVFIHKFDDFSIQKNFAAAKASGDWILAMDDDETISDKLAEEISTILPTTDCVAFGIPRLNYIFGKAMYHTNWEPEADTHIWLWRKNMGKWVGVVHEELVVNGKVQKLHGQKIHHSYKTVEEFIDRANRYTSKEKKATNPIFDFFRRYVWHKGFLDGWHGLFLSYLQAIYHLIVWVKLWEKKNISSLPY